MWKLFRIITAFKNKKKISTFIIVKLEKKDNYNNK